MRFSSTFQYLSNYRRYLMNKLVLVMLALVIHSIAAASELTFADNAGNAVSMECQVANQELAKLMDSAKAAELCSLLESTLAGQGFPKIQEGNRITWKTVHNDRNKAACHIMVLPSMIGRPIPTFFCSSGDAAKKEALETRVRSAVHAALGIK